MTAEKAKRTATLFLGFFYAAVWSVGVVELLFYTFDVVVNRSLLHYSLEPIDGFIMFGIAGLFPYAFLACLLIGFPIYKLLQHLMLNSWVTYLMAGFVAGLCVGGGQVLLLPLLFGYFAPGFLWLTFGLTLIAVPVAALTFWRVVILPERLAAHG